MVERDNECWKLIEEYNKYITDGEEHIYPMWSTGQMLYCVGYEDNDECFSPVAIFENEVEAYKFIIFLMEVKKYNSLTIRLMHPVKRYVRES